MPDWTVGALLCLWVVAVVLVPEGLRFGAWTGLLCGGVALAVALVCYAFGWLGGGDGKLLTVVAMWVGPRDLPLVFLAIALAGLVLLVVALVVPNGDFRRRGIPFACAIAPPASGLLAVRAFVYANGLGS